ncbi:TetR/AcrR family transcriptional regulator [Salinisphaera sp. USBA-960]|uniref:TetR/AcrR family transcriptional regulator n=1 Tax=Salinisphaera orenii TaxID=856731 RepID=UPI000DBE727A|nr:TetR/AcrR family transcriptional regulator [Salifodinibacter halophilus]NNC26361.1 TetR/AcrR family transcriptional regulator [Salifodinibacter halophilus]
MNNKKTTPSTSRTLSAEDWALAALDEMADHGVDAVAVEALARRLGVTKGSFYWHFANREELISAALVAWERRETDVLLERAAAEANPANRIRRLISEVNASRRASRLYLALSTATRPTLVRECVKRVADRRFEFLRTCYLALEHDEQAAHDWALMTFSVFLGSLQARHDLPDQWPPANSEDFDRYVGFLTDQLVPVPADTTTHTPGSATGSTPDP